MIKKLYFATAYLFLLFIVDCNAVIHDAEELLDRVYAVHTTEILPGADYLKAGLGDGQTRPVLQGLIPRVRKTVHFSLGEMVRPVEGVISWEASPYAVVAPLRNLLPQLLNLNCYDTFILGDLKLGINTYLVVPLATAQATTSKATVVAYDPETSTLREAVDDLIRLKGGYSIAMDSEDVEDELHVAYLDGRNVNVPEFFKPITDGRSWISVGLRTGPLDGEHYRLYWIETVRYFTSQLLFPDGETEEEFFSDEELREMVQAAKENFELWTNSLGDFPLTCEAQRSFQELHVELTCWTRLMNEELRLRAAYQKTLTLAPEPVLLQCAALLTDSVLLREYLDQNIDQLQDCASIYNR